MSRPRTRGALLSAFLSALFLGSAAGQATQPEEPVYLEELRVGYQAASFRHAPAPVWLTLANPGSRTQAMHLVVRSGKARCEERLSLPAGGRRRLCVALLLTRRVLVELRDDAGGLLAQRLVEDLGRLTPTRHLLVLDGRPAEQRTRGSRWEDPTLPLTALEAADAPVESICYRGFGAVLLRGVDPGAWSRAQRRALWEHVLRGGTLILTDLAARDLVQRGLLGGLSGTPRLIKRCGRPVQSLDHGLGRVLSFPDDPLADALGSGPKAAQVRQDLGDLVEASREGYRFARLFQDFAGSGWEHPGRRSQGLVLGFFLLYLLAVGPLVMLLLRKVSRRRLAFTVLGLIGAFSLLAPGVAGLVRSGTGRAILREVLYVPPAGSALLLGDLNVVSGGASRYDLEVEGGELAATLLPSGLERMRVWGAQGWQWRPLRLRSTRTLRGERPRLELEMPAWGQQNVALLAEVEGVAPLETRLEAEREGYRLVVRNTTGAPIARAIAMEQGLAIGRQTAFSDLGRLEPGEVKTVRVARGLGRQRRGRDRLGWFRVLEVPGNWETWNTVGRVEHGDTQTVLRYHVISRAEPRLRVAGPALDATQHALRLDPVRVDADLPSAWAGWTLGTSPDRRVVRVISVAPGGPAERAGILPGTWLERVDGERMRTRAQIATFVARHLPGETIRLHLYDPQQGLRWETELPLGVSPGP